MNAKIESRMIFLRRSTGARSAVTIMKIPIFRCVPADADGSSVPRDRSMPPDRPARHSNRDFPLHSTCRFLSAIAIAACCNPATAGVAQTQHSTQAASANAAATASDAPGEADALNAYLAARAWLDADALPPEDSPQARVRLEGTAAVCVLLRLDGRLVGSGNAAPEGTALDSDSPERDLLLRRAVGRAVTKALSDSTIGAVRAAVGDKVTARLSLEVELAAAVRPLIGRTIAEASLRIDAGDEGVALLRGERCFRAYPSRLLAADIASRPDRAITALLLEAGLPVKDLNAFSDADRVSLGRFDTVRLRADSATAAPSRVTRAGRVIEGFELTAGRVRNLAAQLAARLAGQVVPRDPGDPAKGMALLGTLNPTADAYAPPFATARDAALGAVALATAAASAELPQPTRDRAQAQCDRLVRTLEAEERDQAVDCLLAVAARNHADRALRARIAARIATHAAAPPEDPILASLVAAALLSSAEEASTPRAAEIVRELLARHATSPARLIDAAMPLAFVAADPSLDADTRAALARLFGEFSTLARALQIRRADPEFASLAADLEGGLLLPEAGGGMPDTQCLPLATALAMVEPLLPAEGRAARLDSGRAFVRFLAQHVADDPWVGGFRNPGALRGLVRGDLSSDDCPPGPTAAGLLLALAVSENGARFPADADGKAP
jgi:hypothetical protein